MKILVFGAFVAIVSAASISRSSFEAASSSGPQESPEVSTKLFPFIPFALLGLDFLQILDILTRPKPKPKPKHSQHSTNAKLSADDLDRSTHEVLEKVYRNGNIHPESNCLLAFHCTCSLYLPRVCGKETAIPTQVDSSASQNFQNVGDALKTYCNLCNRTIFEYSGSKNSNADDFEAKIFQLEMEIYKVENVEKSILDI